MWDATEVMGGAIGEGLKAEGVDFKMLNLKLNHRSDVMTEVLDSRAIILGSPTINNGIMPAMADIICYMKGLRPTGKIGAAFGSYGWSGEAVKLMTEALRDMNIDIAGEGIRVKFTPRKEDLDKCVELGRQIGRSVMAMDSESKASVKA